MTATILLLIFIGIMVGVLGAVLGLGGGIIIVPVLVIGLGVPIHEAIGASLIVITANSLSTSSVYIKSGLANMHLGAVLAVASVLGALIGSCAAVSLSQGAVMLILGVIQLVTAYLTYIKTKTSKSYIPAVEGENNFFGSSYVDNATGERITYRPVRVWANGAFSFISGVFSGLTGTGGGALIIPGMNIISHMPIKAATATSAYIIGFTAAAGGLVYMAAGYVNPPLVCSIILGIFFGTAISMKLFSRITDKKVSYLFIALLLIISAQMIYRGAEAVF